MNDQFDRVMPVVAADAHLVDHTLYEEQSPSSGRLHAFQLRLQIRRIPALGRWGPATPIGYANHEVLILDEDYYLYRHLRSVVVAVFHGVHRRLGHGCLEPIETLFGQRQSLYRIGDLLHSRAFVARLAWKGKVGDDLPTAVVALCIRPQSALTIGHASL